MSNYFISLSIPIFFHCLPPSFCLISFTYVIFEIIFLPFSSSFPLSLLFPTVSTFPFYYSFSLKTRLLLYVYFSSHTCGLLSKLLFCKWQEPDSHSGHVIHVHFFFFLLLSPLFLSLQCTWPLVIWSLWMEPQPVSHPYTTHCQPPTWAFKHRLVLPCVLLCNYLVGSKTKHRKNSLHCLAEINSGFQQEVLMSQGILEREQATTCLK